MNKSCIFAYCILSLKRTKILHLLFSIVVHSQLYIFIARSNLSCYFVLSKSYQVFNYTLDVPCPSEEQVLDIGLECYIHWTLSSLLDPAGWTITRVSYGDYKDYSTQTQLIQEVQDSAYSEAILSNGAVAGLYWIGSVKDLSEDLIHCLRGQLFDVAWNGDTFPVSKFSFSLRLNI